MNLNKRPFLILAVMLSAALGMAVASISRRRPRRQARDLDHATELKSWENEGGNLAPASTARI